MTWHYSPDGAARFEASEETLRQLARDGKLPPSALLWREGLADWQPAAQVRPDLFETTPPPPPPPPDDAAAPVLLPPEPPPAPAAAYFPPLVPASRPAQSSSLVSAISGSIGLFSGLGGFCCCFGFAVAPIAGLVGVIFGHMAYSATKNDPEGAQDRTLSIVGMITGYLALLVTAVLVLLFFLNAQFSNTHFHWKL